MTVFFGRSILNGRQITDILETKKINLSLGLIEKPLISASWQPTEREIYIYPIQLGDSKNGIEIDPEMIRKY